MTTPHAPVSEPHVPPQSEAKGCGDCGYCEVGAPELCRRYDLQPTPSVPLSEGAGEREALIADLEALLAAEPVFVVGHPIRRAILALRSSTPSTRAEPVAWRKRPNDQHPLFSTDFDEIEWRVSIAKPVFEEGAKPEWFDVQPLYAQPAADADKLREALKPFADIGADYRTGGLRQDLESRAPGLISRLNHMDFRRADQVLNEGAKS